MPESSGLAYWRSEIAAACSALPGTPAAVLDAAMVFGSELTAAATEMLEASVPVKKSRPVTPSSP